jgi:uroporphyrinogen decarboxylase
MSTKKQSEKPFLRVLRGEASVPPPIWLMRQAGRYLPEYRAARAKAGSFKALCYDPVLASEVTLQPIRRFGFDAAILFADLPLPLEGLGQALDYRDGEGPVLEPIRTSADLSKLGLPKFLDRLAPIFETVRRIRAGLGPKTALIGFAGGVWTLATYMIEGGSSRDFTHAKRWALRDAAGFAAAIELLSVATLRYLSAQIQAGAECVQLFDSWAGTLDAEEFERWVIAPTRGIVSQLHAAHPGVPIIGFPRGAGPLYEAYVRQTGVDAIQIDSGIPLEWAAKQLQPLCPVQGNLDPQRLVVGGAAMTAAAAAICRKLGKKPFVFNLGHGILLDTPPEHVAELVRCVRGPSS